MYICFMDALAKIVKKLRADSEEWSLNQYILLCVKGSAKGMLDGKPISINANDVLYKTKITFVTITSVSNDAEFIQLIPNKDFWTFFQGIMLNATEIQPFNSPLIHLKTISTKVIIEEAKKLFSIQEKIKREVSPLRRDLMQKQYGLYCVYSCIDVLSLMVKNNEQQKKSETNLLSSFIGLLYTQCYERRDVAFYAQEMCMSTSHFSHLIQKESGHSPKYWISKITIEQIKSDLGNNLSMKKIVERFHFTDITHLQRFFKRNAKCNIRDFVD